MEKQCICTEVEFSKTAKGPEHSPIEVCLSGAIGNAPVHLSSEGEVHKCCIQFH